MPILLGQLRTTDGSDHYKERSSIARAQFLCIKSYLYFVGKFFAAQLLKRGQAFPGYELADYINSEALALSLGPEIGYQKPRRPPPKPDEYPSPWREEAADQRPYPTLVAAKEKASAERHGRPLSWVFERLHELAAGSKFVFVRDMPRPAQPLGGKTDYKSYEKQDEDFEKVEYAVADVYYGDPRSFDPELPQDFRGETYVHELVIHAWRHVKFGAISPGYREPSAPDKQTRERQARLYQIYGHHRDGVHALDDKRLPHSRADQEADLLWYYLKRREPFDRKTKRPKHPTGEFQQHIRSIGEDGLMCEKQCRLPELYRKPGVQGR